MKGSLVKSIKIVISCVLILFVSCLSLGVVETKEEKSSGWKIQRLSAIDIAISDYLESEKRRIASKKDSMSVIDITGKEVKIEISPGEKKLLLRNEVPSEYTLFVIKLARHYRIDSHVLISLVMIESLWGRVEGYNEIGNRGYGPNKEWADIGLGQLNSRYHDEFAEKHFNPQLLRDFGYEFGEFDATNGFINLQVSASILNSRYTIFGSYDEALKAYNAGTYAVKNNFPGFDQRGINKVEDYAYSIINNKQFIVKKI